MKTMQILLAGTSFILMLGFVAHSQNITDKTQKENIQVQKGTTTGRNFIDSNNNGICDRFEERGKTTRGAGFIDKDGDGICDNRQGGNQKGNRQACDGTGFKHRNGKGKGTGNCDGTGKRMHQGWQK